MRLNCPDTGRISYRQLAILISIMSEEQKDSTVTVRNEQEDYYDIELSINTTEDILVLHEPFLSFPLDEEE